MFYQMVSELEQENDVDPLQIAAALAMLLQGEVPLLLDERERRPREDRRDQRRPDRKSHAGERPERPERPERDEGRREREAPIGKARPLKDFPDLEMERFRLAIGHQHGVKPGNIVGAIANEAEIESRYIGQIDIQDEFSLVDLPSGMPDETFRVLRNVWVCGRKLAIERVGGDAKQPQKDKPRKPKPKPKPKSSANS